MLQGYGVVLVTDYRKDNTGIFYKTWGVNDLARMSALNSANLSSKLTFYGDY
jgi:hypothetical protein